jgi:peptidoglycan/LPS O-acetylase OafA/YrhL
MDITPSLHPRRAERGATSIAFIVVAALWLAVGAASRRRGLHADGDDWETPYAIFTVLLMVAAGAALLVVAMHTAQPGERSATRTAAVALAVLAAASTIVAWAFPVWAVLLTAAFAALGATGRRDGRQVGWIGAALMVGLGVAIVGATAKLGAPGESNDYSEAQTWGITVACLLVAGVLGALAVLDRRGVPVHGAR